jgi:hypothetical protein
MHVSMQVDVGRLGQEAEGDLTLSVWHGFPRFHLDTSNDITRRIGNGWLQNDQLKDNDYTK